MLTLHPDLFVTVQQIEGDRAPRPLPLASGFSAGTAYRVLGAHAPSETGEAYFIFSNDRDEVWFISNRHFRTHALVPGSTDLRRALPVAEPVLAPPSGDGQLGAAPTLRHPHYAPDSAL